MYLRNDRILTALSVMLDVAFYAGRSGVVSGADIAGRNGLLRRGIEPVLQALSRERLLDSLRGPRGGYRLGRSPRMITLHNVAMAVCNKTVDEDVLVAVCPLMHKVMIPLWKELDKTIDKRLMALTLDDLLNNAEKVGLSRPCPAPVSFSI